MGLFGPPRAKPGYWYGGYHEDWTLSHPGAFERGELQAGSFHKGDVWCSSTLEWDKQWFRSHGMRPPRRMRKAGPPVGIPLASQLGPGESVSFHLRIEDAE